MPNGITAVEIPENSIRVVDSMVRPLKSVVISFGSTEYGVIISWLAIIHSVYTRKYAHTGMPGTNIRMVTSNVGTPSRIRKRRRPAMWRI